MSKQDQAARIAEKAREIVNDGEPVWSRETIAKDIRRAITAAVRKERERCVKVAKSAECPLMHTKQSSDYLNNIIKAIRKGKA